jgi:hypothetical protein
MLDNQVGNRLLKKREIGLALERLTHRRAIQGAISLRTSGAHRRPLAPVQDTEMYAGSIRSPCHPSAQRIDFLHQVTLANSANRRIAAHLPERLDILRQK